MVKVDGDEDKKDSLQVQADSSHDKFVGRQSGVDYEGIIYDVSTEDQAASNSIDQVHGLAKWNEQVDQSSHAYIMEMRLHSTLYLDTHKVRSMPRRATAQGPQNRTRIVLVCIALEQDRGITP